MDAKRSTFRLVSIEIFWNNTFHVKSLMTKILTMFKATQAKSLKIVVAKSSITNCPHDDHYFVYLQGLCKATIVLHIQSNPNGKRYYRAFIVNFTLKIEIVPQQELRVLGGREEIPELVTTNFWALLEA